MATPTLYNKNVRSMPSWVNEQSGRIGPKPPPPPIAVKTENSPVNITPEPVRLINNKNINKIEPDYEVIDFSGQQYSNEPMKTKATTDRPKSTDTKLKCTLCGSNNPWVICDACSSQIFCASCDDMFHKHPKRREHVRKAVEQSRPPLPPKAGNTSATPPIAPPRRNKRGFTPLLPRKEQVSSDRSTNNTPESSATMTAQHLHQLQQQQQQQHTIPQSPTPSTISNSTNSNSAWNERLGSLKRGTSLLNRPLPDIPKTPTTPSDQASSSRSTTPKSVFDTIQRPPSVQLEKIKHKASATLDRMTVLQQRYRQHKAEQEHERLQNGLGKDENISFDHWSSLSSIPSHIRSGSMSSGLNSSHFDQLDESQFHLFNQHALQQQHQQHQMQQQRQHQQFNAMQRPPVLGRRGMSTSVFNLNQISQRPTIEANTGWMGNNMQQAQSMAQLNCANMCSLPPTGMCGHNDLRQQQHLNNSNLSLNVPHGYMRATSTNPMGMYPPPVFMNQQGMLGNMFPYPYPYAQQPGFVPVTPGGYPMSSRPGSRLASPAMSRKSLSMRRKQRSSYVEDELTDDEDSDEDDRRSIISNRSAMTNSSRMRPRRMSSASQMLNDDNRDMEAAAAPGHKQSARTKYRQQRRSSVTKSLQGEWLADKPTATTTATPKTNIPIARQSSQASAATTPSKIYSDLESEGSGARALVQAKIQQKLQEEEKTKRNANQANKTQKANASNRKDQSTEIEHRTPGTKPMQAAEMTSELSTENSSDSESEDDDEEEKGKPAAAPAPAPASEPAASANETAADDADNDLPELGPPPSTPDYEWTCEFCTFVNEPKTKICAICCKTPTTTAVKKSSSPATSSARAESTTNNGQNDKTKPARANATVKKAISPMQASNESLNDVWVNLEKNIQATASEVTAKAREKHKQTTRGRASSSREIATSPPALRRTPSVSSQISGTAKDRTRPTSSNRSSCTREIATSPTPLRSTPSESSEISGTARGRSQHTSSNRSSPAREIPTSPSPFSERPTNLKEIGTSPPPQSISTQTYETVVIKKPSVIEPIANKNIEKPEPTKFTMEEFQIALKYSGGTMDPMQWLRENWQKLIQTVQSLSTMYGQELTENTIGTISLNEAREALRLHNGNVWQAVSECIEDRRKKFNFLSSKGHFLRDDIVTALTTHQGNVEAALLELERTNLKPFLMRIWGSPGGVENESIPAVIEQQAAMFDAFTQERNIEKEFHDFNALGMTGLQSPNHSDYLTDNALQFQTNLANSTRELSGVTSPSIDEYASNPNALKDIEIIINNLERNQANQNQQVLQTIEGMLENFKGKKDSDQEFSLAAMRTKSPITTPKSQSKTDIKSFVWQHIQEIVPSLVQQVEMELLERQDGEVANTQGVPNAQQAVKEKSEPPSISADEYIMKELIEPNLRSASIREELPPMYTTASPMIDFIADKKQEKVQIGLEPEQDFLSIHDAPKVVFKMFKAPEQTEESEEESGTDASSDEVNEELIHEESTKIEFKNDPVEAKKLSNITQLEKIEGTPATTNKPISKNKAVVSKIPVRQFRSSKITPFSASGNILQTSPLSVIPDNDTNGPLTGRELPSQSNRNIAKTLKPESEIKKDKLKDTNKIQILTSDENSLENTIRITHNKETDGNSDESNHIPSAQNSLTTDQPTTFQDREKDQPKETNNMEKTTDQKDVTGGMEIFTSKVSNSAEQLVSQDIEVEQPSTSKDHQSKLRSLNSKKQLKTDNKKEERESYGTKKVKVKKPTERMTDKINEQGPDIRTASHVRDGNTISTNKDNLNREQKSESETIKVLEPDEDGGIKQDNDDGISNNVIEEIVDLGYLADVKEHEEENPTARLDNTEPIIENPQTPLGTVNVSATKFESNATQVEYVNHDKSAENYLALDATDRRDPEDSGIGNSINVSIELNENTESAATEKSENLNDGFSKSQNIQSADNWKEVTASTTEAEKESPANGTEKNIKESLPVVDMSNLNVQAITTKQQHENTEFKFSTEKQNLTELVEDTQRLIKQMKDEISMDQFESSEEEYTGEFSDDYTDEEYTDEEYDEEMDEELVEEEEYTDEEVYEEDDATEDEPNSTISDIVEEEEAFEDADSELPAEEVVLITIESESDAKSSHSNASLDNKTKHTLLTQNASSSSLTQATNSKNVTLSQSANDINLLSANSEQIYENVASHEKELAHSEHAVQLADSNVISISEEEQCFGAPTAEKSPSADVSTDSVLTGVITSVQLEMKGSIVLNETGGDALQQHPVDGGESNILEHLEDALPELNTDIVIQHLLPNQSIQNKTHTNMGQNALADLSALQQLENNIPEVEADIVLAHVDTKQPNRTEQTLHQHSLSSEQLHTAAEAFNDFQNLQSNQSLADEANMNPQSSSTEQLQTSIEANKNNSENSELVHVVAEIKSAPLDRTENRPNEAPSTSKGILAIAVSSISSTINQLSLVLGGSSSQTKAKFNDNSEATHGITETNQIEPASAARNEHNNVQHKEPPTTSSSNSPIAMATEANTADSEQSAVMQINDVHLQTDESAILAIGSASVAASMKNTPTITVKANSVAATMSTTKTKTANSKIPKAIEKKEASTMKKSITRSKSFSLPPPTVPIGMSSVKVLQQELLRKQKQFNGNSKPAPAPKPIVRKKSITEAISKFAKPFNGKQDDDDKPTTSSAIKFRTHTRIPKKKYHETCFSDDDYELTTDDDETDVKIQSNQHTTLQRKQSVPIFQTYPSLIEPANLDPQALAEKYLNEKLVSNQAEAQLAAALVNMKFPENASLNAAKECNDLDQAIAYLRQECELCMEVYAMNEIVSMLKCTHKCCKQCAKQYFTVQITERSINDCNCPFCKMPELGNQTEHEDEHLEYFSNLDIFLKSILDEEVHELFQRKLRDRSLLQDPNFKWCIQCSSGFFARPKQKRLICPDCGSITCAQCRKPWEAQHEGVPCEAYLEWKEANDPELQIKGVQEHLAQNGIDCPKCKFRFSLARGGCMHFTCTQCKYEFCYGCGKPFMMGAKCNRSPYCAKLGLHAHHPRNCLFYLRDKLPLQLQFLLKEHGVSYDVEPVANALNGNANTAAQPTTINRCPIPLQKETPQGLVDTICSNEVPEQHAGMCRLHYVEYLTAKVAKSKIDPLPIFDLTDCVQELRRRGIALPERGPWDTDDIYKKMCAELIKQQIPLESD